jgi:hypothetical protein
MYAEAVNEINNGPTPEAVAAFEEVRKRAYRGNTALIGITPTTKQGFFDAIVNERWLEFGHEAVRKYDLIRWNMLSAKLTETRAKITDMSNRTGAYTNVPQYIYYKNVGEEIVYYTAWDSTGKVVPWYKPTQVPPAGTTGSAGVPANKWVRIDWAEHLKANVIDSKPLATGMASFFTPGKSELFPFDQATMDSYQGRLKQNPGY